MIYNDFKGKKISSLGFGTMRLPVIDGRDADIDVEKSRAMFDYALKNGVNYFDTAWGYHSGNSERVVGEILSSYPRESFYLASKYPGYDVENIGKNGEIFEEQLKKCKTEYFDFYLIHCVDEENIDAYLDEKKGMLKYLLEQKQKGRIRHLGFSMHCTLETMNRFLKVYGPYMEFAQIQLNYIDYHFQEAKAKLEVLEKLGIDVWVMEPVRGGKLANLPDDLKQRVEGMRNTSAVEMAFRYLQSFPCVKVILSGMSDMEQIKDNIRIFSEVKPTTNEENEVLYSVARKIVGKGVACTGCKYCISHCPKGIDIPQMIEYYNSCLFTGDKSAVENELKEVIKEKRPEACVSCCSCEKVCPQEIKISQVLADLVQKLK